MSNFQASDYAPQSFITKDKQRLKQFDDTVYLNNGDEFQIELFNPKQNKILIKIELDGKSIGSGVVLRPGERVFLERYLDIAKKFLFETYNVDNTLESKNAIGKNGNVNIKFFDESPLLTTLSGSFSTTTTAFPPFGSWQTYTAQPTYGTTCLFTSSVPDFNVGTATTTTSISNNTLSNNNPKRRKVSKSIDSKSIETGRVEKGSDSNQKFTSDSTSFQSYPTTTKIWKLLPQSQKYVVKEDIKVFCTECGTRRRKDSFKFCPNCGNKL